MSSGKWTIVFETERAASKFFTKFPLSPLGVSLGSVTHVNGDIWSDEMGYGIDLTLTQPLSDMEREEAEMSILLEANAHGKNRLHTEDDWKNAIEDILELKVSYYAVDWKVIYKLLKTYSPTELLVMFPNNLALVEILILGGYDIYTVIDFAYNYEDTGLVREQCEPMSYLQLCLSYPEYTDALHIILKYMEFDRVQLIEIIDQVKHNQSAIRILAEHLKEDMVYELLIKSLHHYPSFSTLLGCGIDPMMYGKQLIRDLKHCDPNVFRLILTKCDENDLKMLSLTINQKLMGILLQYAQNKNVRLSANNVEPPLIPLLVTTKNSVDYVEEGDEDVQYNDLIFLKEGQEIGEEISMSLSNDTSPYKMTINFDNSSSARDVADNAETLLGTNYVSVKGNEVSLSLKPVISPPEVYELVSDYPNTGYEISM